MDLPGLYCGSGADPFELGHEVSVSMRDGKCYHCSVGYNLAKESTERNHAVETSHQCSSYGIHLEKKQSLESQNLSFALLCITVSFTTNWQFS